MSHETTRPVPMPPSGPPQDEQPAEAVAELDQLETLGDLPLADHVTVYDSIHRALAEQLSAAET